jgi:DHA1 family bicyclomycin/chloramphenicol resistance-like MFS transporter
MYLPALPAIARGLNATPGQVGLTLAASFFGLGFGQLIYGPVSDRIGRRGPLIFGMSLFLVGAVMCALAPSIWWLVAARFLQALGGSAGQVVARASVRDQFEHQMAARVLSLLMLVLGLAPIVAPIFGGYLLLVGDWRSIFWFQAAVAAVILVATILRAKETRPEHVLAQALRENALGAYRAVLSNRRVVGYVLCGMFNGGAFFSWLSLSSYLLIEVYGVTPEHFGWWFGANAAGFIAMSQVNAWLLKRHLPEEVLARARLFSIVSSLVLVVTAFTGFGGMLGVIIPLYITLGSFGLVGPNTQAAAMNVDVSRTGSIASLSGAASFAVGTVISTLAGFMRDGTARPLAMLILVLILLSSAALYGLARPLKPAAAAS